MSRRHNIVSEISNDFLTCHICWETYQKPKTLPCGHFFCRVCLINFCNTCRCQPNLSSLPTGASAGLDSKRLVHCPTCRKAVGEIPFHGNVHHFVDLLPDNFYVNSLKDLVDHHYTERSRSRSDIEDKRQADTVDQKFPQRSLSVSDGTAGGRCQASLPLGAHGGGIPCIEHTHEAIEMYCTIHNKVLCRSCRGISHSRCEGCLSIDSAEYRFIRPRLQAILASLSNRRLGLSNMLRQYIRQLQCLNVDSFAIEKNIDDTYRALQTKLERCCVEIKEELKQVISQHDKDLKEKQESVKLKESLIDETVTHVEMISKKGEAMELASLLSVLDITEGYNVDSTTTNSQEGEAILATSIKLAGNESLRMFLDSEENMFGKIVLGNDSPEFYLAGSSDQTELRGAAAGQDKTRQRDTATREEWRSLVQQTTQDQTIHEDYLHLDVSSVTERETSQNLTTTFHAKDCVKPFLTLDKKAEFRIATPDMTDVCCMLKNGDIAGLKPSEKSVFLCRQNGIVADQILLPTVPLGLSACKDSKRRSNLAVTGYGSKIYFLSSSPRLKLVRSIPTRAQYTGISNIPKRLSLVAVASCEWPPVVDLISLQGMVLKTFGFTDSVGHLFEEPRLIATSSDFIFVPDGKELKAISWDSGQAQVIEGIESRSYNLSSFGGIKSVCTIEDIVLTIDFVEGKLYALRQTGGTWVQSLVLEDKILMDDTCSLTAAKNDTVLISKGHSVFVFTVDYYSTEPRSPVRSALKSLGEDNMGISDQYRTL